MCVGGRAGRGARADGAASPSRGGSRRGLLARGVETRATAPRASAASARLPQPAVPALIYTSPAPRSSAGAGRCRLFLLTHLALILCVPSEDRRVRAPRAPCSIYKLRPSLALAAPCLGYFLQCIYINVESSPPSNFVIFININIRNTIILCKINIDFII